MVCRCHIMLFVPRVLLVVIYHLTMHLSLPLNPEFYFILFCWRYFLIFHWYRMTVGSHAVWAQARDVIRTVHLCSWLCTFVPDCALLCIYCALVVPDCAFSFLTVHWLCTQASNPKKENSREIFRNQGKCLVIPGTSYCALYLYYHVCAEFFAEAVKGTVLWYFICGPFYFCSLDSWEFWFMKCI